MINELLHKQGPYWAGTLKLLFEIFQKFLTAYGTQNWFLILKKSRPNFEWDYTISLVTNAIGMVNLCHQLLDNMFILLCCWSTHRFNILYSHVNVWSHVISPCHLLSYLYHLAMSPNTRRPSYKQIAQGLLTCFLDQVTTLKCIKKNVVSRIEQIASQPLQIENPYPQQNSFGLDIRWWNHFLTFPRFRTWRNQYKRTRCGFHNWSLNFFLGFRLQFRFPTFNGLALVSDKTFAPPMIDAS